MFASLCPHIYARISITVLEEVTASFMTFIEGDRISGHETAHDFAQGCRTGSQQNMEMVGDQRPCITLSLGFFEDNGQAIQEGFSVLIVPEDFTAFYAAGHYVL